MSKTEKFSERLRVYRERTGVSQEELADKLGVSRNYVSMMEGGREPSESLRKLFEIIETAPDASITIVSEDFSHRLQAWRKRTGQKEKEAARVLGIGVVKYKELEAGRGPSPTCFAKFEELEHAGLRVAEEILGERYERVREQSRVAGGLRTKAPADNEGRVMKVRKVPLVGWTQAGEAVAFEDVVDWDNVVSVPTNNPKAIAILVKGDSMMPLIAEGDIVVVSPGDEPANEKYVVAKLRGDGIVCKQFRRLTPARYELRSMNQFYQPLIVEARDVVWIYPVVQLIKTSL